MYLVMIIFCESCLSSVGIQDFNVHPGMDMLLRFLRDFSICVQDLSMRPIKRVLDMNPTMSRLW